MSELPVSLGWHVISGEHFLECLRRVAAGEDPGIVMAELWANAEREQAAPGNLEYVPQLLAAIDRHCDADNWASWGAVETAVGAVRGHGSCQSELDHSAEWKLDAGGRLP